MLLFFVRHGDPIYQPDSLTELGKQQAEALVQGAKSGFLSPLNKEIRRHVSITK